MRLASPDRAREGAERGLSLSDFDVYFGVSSGSFVAACLAVGLDPFPKNTLHILIEAIYLLYLRKEYSRRFFGKGRTDVYLAPRVS
jgi:hypothetical protein